MEARQKQIDDLTARLEQRAAQIQKLSAQLSKRAPQVASNNESAYSNDILGKSSLPILRKAVGGWTRRQPWIAETS